MNDYKIKKLMEEMEKELIISMKRNLSNHLKEEDEIGFKFPQWQSMKLKEMKKYQRENKIIIDNYTKGLSNDISNHLKGELTQGAKKSIKEYNGFAPKKIKSSKVLNKSFFKTNDRKVNSLIKVVNNDLKTANTSALRMINDEYRQIIHKSAFFLANGVVSPQKAIDMATKDFLTRGLNCIEYKDGRRVNIASYSEMAIRTASLRAQLMGDGDFRESIGRHLVIATASNAACPLCSKWENKIMIDDVYSGGTKKDGNYPMLSEAMKQGFLHPNCRDGIATYYPELEDIDKSYEDGKDGSESDEAYQEDLNYINQKIKQFERLSLGSIDEENIRFYESKKNEWEDRKTLEELVIEVRETISDTFQERTKGIKIGRNISNSYFDGISNKIYLKPNADKFTLIHELGHKLQENFTKEEQKRYNKIIKNKFSKYTKNDFKKIENSTGKYWILKDSSEFVSKYQTRVYNGRFNFKLGRVNEKYLLEYFSEGIKYYYKNPELLKEKDLELFKFIERTIK